VLTRDWAYTIGFLTCVWYVGALTRLGLPYTTHSAIEQPPTNSLGTRLPQPLLPQALLVLLKEPFGPSLLLQTARERGYLGLPSPLLAQTLHPPARRGCRGVSPSSLPHSSLLCHRPPCSHSLAHHHRPPAHLGGVHVSVCVCECVSVCVDGCECMWEHENMSILCTRKDIQYTVQVHTNTWIVEPL